MYRLLIADDEEWIRKGIAETIDWAAFGIALIGEAADAVTAIELVRRFRPDIIVTDIVMPGPNGIELLGWIKQEQPDSKVILISGHDQFHYAREALRKGAFDYLLKPLEESVLLETVRNAIQALLQERNRDERAERYTTSLKGLKQLFFMKLMDKKGTEPLLTGDEAQYLKLHLQEKKQYACAIWCFAEHDNGKVEMICDLIERAISKQLPNLLIDSLILTKQIVILAEGQGDVQEQLYCLFGSLESIILLIPSCGCCISKNGTGTASLREIVSETATTIDNQFILQGVMRVQELSKHQNNHLSDCRICIKKFLETIDITCERDFHNEASWLIHEIFMYVPGIGKTELGSILFQVMTKVADQYQKQGIAIEMPVTEKNEAVAWVFCLESMEQAINGLQQFLLYLYDHISGRDPQQRSYLIEKSLNYIDANFHRDISADEMSSYLNISKAYFSQLFSREVGSTFIRYLTKRRIDHAQNLLVNTTDRIYEVAEACGYNDVKYFLKVFKKIKGESPQSYRERRR